MDARRVVAVLLVLSMARSVTGKDPWCYEPLDLGDSRCPTLLSTRFYYNQEKEKCQTFLYTGCGGNSNNFPNLYACKECCEWDMTCYA
nr:conotoxin precursor conkunitzin [Conus judaeus]UMA83700.1 conotoxin precursor conkunitzin [Conus judaeus]